MSTCTCMCVFAYLHDMHVPMDVHVYVHLLLYFFFMKQAFPKSCDNSSRRVCLEDPKSLQEASGLEWIYIHFEFCLAPNCTLWLHWTVEPKHQIGTVISLSTSLANLFVIEYTSSSPYGNDDTILQQTISRNKMLVPSYSIVSRPIFAYSSLIILDEFPSLTLKVSHLYRNGLSMLCSCSNRQQFRLVRFESVKLKLFKTKPFKTFESTKHETI